MDPNIVLRLEGKIDQLIARHSALEHECRSLTSERDALLNEKNRILGELDRILEKLESLGPVIP